MKKKTRVTKLKSKPKKNKVEIGRLGRFVIDDNALIVKHSLSIMSQVLKNNPNLYSSWQSKIATNFIDECEIALGDGKNIWDNGEEIANQAAKKFLDTLMTEGLKE